MLRTGARFSSKFSGRSARERDCHENFQDAPSRRSARERDFSRSSQDAPHGSASFLNFQNAPHGSAIVVKIFKTLRTGARFFLKIFRMLCTGARSSSKFSRLSARERDFGQKRTILSGSVWYRIGIEIAP